MSSYLTFYLVPKKTKKSYYCDDAEGEKEIELSTGKPLALFSFSRNNEIYRVFNENLHPAYAGMEENYTEITTEDCQTIINELGHEVEKVKSRLETDYKILKNSGFSDEMYEQIHTMEDYAKELTDTINEVKNIRDIVYECKEMDNDFEKVLINID